MVDEDMVIIAGTSVPGLANKISRHLGGRRPWKILANNEITTFSDNEISVEIFDSVRGKDVYIIQSTCVPVNDNLMELLLVADALKRSSVRSITAVIPYLGYSRQDRRPKFRRMPISARLVADMIQASGINSVITVDLHSVQIQGMYDIPLVNVSASSRFAADIYQRYETKNVMVVSPDAGGVERARSFGKQLDVDLAVIDKRRPKANVSEVMNVLGEVEGNHCILVDDLVDTAGTLCKGAVALMDHGATGVSAYCTHPVLSGGAIDNLNNSVLSELVVADTIPLHTRAKDCGKIRIVSLSESLGETVRRAHADESISSIYVMD